MGMLLSWDSLGSKLKVHLLAEQHKSKFICYNALVNKENINKVSCSPSNMSYFVKKYKDRC